MKNVRFQTKPPQFRVIARSAATWQSESQRYGIPWRSTGVRSKNHKKHGNRCFVSRPFSLFQGSVSFRATIVRFGMTNRSVKDCRVGRTRPPRNDKICRFCGEMKRFSEQKVSNFSGAIPRKKQPQKNRKNRKRPFSNKDVPIFVSLRGAQRRGNLKAEGMAFRGEAREHEAKGKPYHKKHEIRCVVPLPLSLFQGSVSFRATIVRFGMANRSV